MAQESVDMEFYIEVLYIAIHDIVLIKSDQYSQGKNEKTSHYL